MQRFVIDKQVHFPRSMLVVLPEQPSESLPRPATTTTDLAVVPAEIVRRSVRRRVQLLVSIYNNLYSNKQPLGIYIHKTKPQTEKINTSLTRQLQNN